jgi:hypothetical protein
VPETDLKKVKAALVRASQPWIESRSDGWKLAGDNVPGGREKTSRPERTMEMTLPNSFWDGRLGQVAFEF